jgi:hypothetical protein
MSSLFSLSEGLTEQGSRPQAPIYATMDPGGPCEFAMVTGAQVRPVTRGSATIERESASFAGTIATHAFLQ